MALFSPSHNMKEQETSPNFSEQNRTQNTGLKFRTFIVGVLRMKCRCLESERNIFEDVRHLFFCEKYSWRNTHYILVKFKICSLVNLIFWQMGYESERQFYELVIANLHKKTWHRKYDYPHESFSSGLLRSQLRVSYYPSIK